jgi:hypothetical protein
VDKEIVSWIVQGAIVCLAGLAVYFAQRTHNRMEKDIEDRKKEIGELKAEMKAETACLRRELDDMRNKMPFTYVLREDFIRLMASFEHKLDVVLARRSKNDI